MPEKKIKRHPYQKGLITRNEDMSPDGQLVICVEEDGDIIIGVKARKETQGRMLPSVEFCCTGPGGGRSPHTRKALMDLITAIELDNKENPIY